MKRRWPIIIAEPQLAAAIRLPPSFSSSSPPQRLLKRLSGFQAFLKVKGNNCFHCLMYQDVAAGVIRH
jgi:hypothetical protein